MFGQLSSAYPFYTRFFFANLGGYLVLWRIKSGKLEKQGKTYFSFIVSNQSSN